MSRVPTTNAYSSHRERKWEIWFCGFIVTYMWVLSLGHMACAMLPLTQHSCLDQSRLTIQVSQGMDEVMTKSVPSSLFLLKIWTQRHRARNQTMAGSETERSHSDGNRVAFFSQLQTEGLAEKASLPKEVGSLIHFAQRTGYELTCPRKEKHGNCGCLTNRWFSISRPGEAQE